MLWIYFSELCSIAHLLMSTSVCLAGFFMSLTGKIHVVLDNPVLFQGVRKYFMYFWFPNCCLQEWPRLANFSSVLFPGVPARIYISPPSLPRNVAKRLRSPVWAGMRVTCRIFQAGLACSSMSFLFCSLRLRRQGGHCWGHRSEKLPVTHWSRILVGDFTGGGEKKACKLRRWNLGFYLSKWCAPL